MLTQTNLKILHVSTKAVGANEFIYAIVILDAMTRRVWVLHRTFEDIQTLRKRMLSKLDETFGHCTECIGECGLFKKLPFPRTRLLSHRSPSSADERAAQLFEFLHNIVVRVINRRPDKHSINCKRWLQVKGYADDLLHGVERGSSTGKHSSRQIVVTVAHTGSSKSLDGLVTQTIMDVRTLEPVKEENSEEC